jgi:hypothetical protein
MVLKSGETHLEAENLALKIAQTYDEEDRSPFPYEGCRWLRGEFDGELDNLIPDLDMWLLDITGFSSRGKRLLNLPEEKVSHARGIMSLSFFDKYPEYAWLERHITESDTPDLYEKINLYEGMRRMLVTLFDLLLRERDQE